MIALKIYNPDLKKELVDELMMLDRDYFQLDKTVPFIKGIITGNMDNPKFLEVKYNIPLKTSDNPQIIYNRIKDYVLHSNH